MTKAYLSNIVHTQALKYGDRVALKYRDYSTETWIPVSWNEFDATVNQVANAMIATGIDIQENMGIFSQNKPECFYTDFAAFNIRAVTIPLYATSSESQVHYILEDAQIHYLFVGEQYQYDVAHRVQNLCKSLKQIIIFDPAVKIAAGDNNSIYFSDFIKRAEGNKYQAEIDKRIEDSNIDDLANILYTSGTTGESKGVMLHHICYNTALDAHKIILPNITEKDVILNFLPFTHIFERGWAYVCIHRGCTLCINLRPQDIQKTIKEIRPTAM